MMDVLQIAIQASPVLVMALAIALIPLLSDDPTKRSSTYNEDAAPSNLPGLKGIARVMDASPE